MRTPEFHYFSSLLPGCQITDTHILGKVMKELNKDLSTLSIVLMNVTYQYAATVLGRMQSRD